MPLSEAAIQLLLELLEQQHPVLSGPALADFHAASGKELIAAGLLVPDGYEPVDTNGEHDDLPVVVTSSDDVPGFGFFKPQSGWVTVEAARLNRYRVDRGNLIARLTGQRGQPGNTGRHIDSDEIWYLGSLRLPHRNRRVPILLLRGVSDPSRWKEARRWLMQNPPDDGQRVLMCAAPADRLPDDPPHGNVMMSLADVIDRDGGFRLDSQIIAARLDLMAGAVQPSGPLVVLGDGREVQLHGEIFRFLKGEQQRRIICAIHERYLRGELMTSWSGIVDHLDLPANARFRDYFKKSKPPVLGRLLREKGGMVGFVLRR